MPALEPPRWIFSHRRRSCGEGELITMGAQPVRTDTNLADLANGFANKGHGPLRMQLDQAAVRGSPQSRFVRELG